MSYQAIDFEEIKQLSEKILDGKEKSGKPKGKKKEVAIIVVIAIILIILIDDFLLGLAIATGTLVLIGLIYDFSEDEQIEFYKEKLNLFPDNTPEGIFGKLYYMGINEIEEYLYKDRLIIQHSESLGDAKHKILGVIEGEDEDEFIRKAYKLKADTIICYSHSSNTTSNVKTDALTKRVKTDVSRSHLFQGTAVKILE